MVTPAPTTADARRAPDAAAESLRRLAVDRAVDPVPWLASLREPGTAARVAERSYWHHNGFAKLVLDQSPDRTVRLHVWPAGPDRLGESNPHGHLWNFGSIVLCGDGIVQRRYTEDPLGIPYIRHTYERRSGVRSLTPVGNARLVESEPIPVRTGQSYCVDTSIVHTVEPLGDALTATVVAQGPTAMESTMVYCRPGRPVDGVGRRMTVDDVLGLVRDVAATVDGARGSQR